MGQRIIKENIFRDGIIHGLEINGIKYSRSIPYPSGLNYGLIIKPLYLDMKFRLPVMLYFSGLPYHVGIVRYNRHYKESRDVYSFCPDLREPHRGTLIKDIKHEDPMAWIEESELCEIFWILDSPTDEFPTIYDKITARLIDGLNIQSIGLEEFNRRHRSTLGMAYNLLTNNCTHFALCILTGKAVCYQIDYIKPIILELLKKEEVISQLPDYAKYWISDFKTE